jgi:class 3 adenylate cyclase
MVAAVRMALHGRQQKREDDYVGPILNRLGRLLSVSHGGQILLTQATQAVDEWLPRICEFAGSGSAPLEGSGQGGAYL